MKKRRLHNALLNVVGLMIVVTVVLLSPQTAQADRRHLRSDGRGGFYTEDHGHIRTDGNGGYYLPDHSRIRSDGRGGYYLPDSVNRRQR